MTREVQTGFRNFFDQKDSFGWISIVLHWISAIAVIAIWFLGFDIRHNPDMADLLSRRNLHIFVALLIWLLLLARIIWRLYMGHPRARGQTNFQHSTGTVAHILMLTLMVIMMLSGPLLTWASATPAEIFGGLYFPVASEPHSTIAGLALWLHRNAAIALIAIISLHFLASMAYLMFHDDDTFERMLWPKKK